MKIRLSGQDQKRNLEEYLQDLICCTRAPQEVGVLVETLMSLQLPSALGDTAENTEARL